MLLSEPAWAFLGFILSTSGAALGKETSVCVLKGSSVTLTCSTDHPTADLSWHTIRKNYSAFDLKELSVDGKNVAYKINEDSNYTLTINDVKESDESLYCCREITDKPELCWQNRVQLRVADLQVKVFPAPEGNKVTLMCRTSCPLTENPSAFIWYKNQQFLYEDWSSWYRELVSSEVPLKYSCAIKGYEDLRAPEVSVDSVTSACFQVTYAKGTMCSRELKSAAEPCSITYPRDVHVQMSPEKYFLTITCNTSCPAADPHTAFRWYQYKHLYCDCKDQDLTVFGSNAESFSCAVMKNEDLHSKEICTDPLACSKVNYVRRRVCALEGSSVDISSVYSLLTRNSRLSKSWYKMLTNFEEGGDALAPVEAVGPVEYDDSEENHHTLRMNDLKRNDSGTYMFFLRIPNVNFQHSDLPGMMLVVTGLKVTMFPSAVVTEGQRVTLTCSTSCPLMDNTSYIWYFNSQPLNELENQNKHLDLDPVSSLYAGNYSCAVRAPRYISSPEEVLTVKVLAHAVAILNILKVAVLFLIPSLFVTLHSMMRKR